MLKSLCEHPGRFNKQVLRGRLVAVASDGAGTRGGKDSQHGSTAAAELFWSCSHPEADANVNLPVDWDLFHRAELAVSKAVGETPCAFELFDVLRALVALFGVGDGRVVFRAAADAIGAKRFRVPDQGGARKVVALIGTVEHLLKNMKVFHAGLHARIGQVSGRTAAEVKPRER